MYIWVILATFMAMLYSFNLAVRNDMRKIRVEPMAETVIAQLVIQHRAAVDFIRNRMPPKNGSNVITYDKGVLGCASSLSNYLPYGYSCDTEFVSEVYCMRKDNWAQGIGDCKSADAMKYLITYGPVPQKWLNLSSNTPTNDVLNAMQNVVGLDTSLGYVVDVSHAKYKKAVKGREDNVVYIPNYVVENGGFKSTCVCNNCRRCLVYVTPFE